MLIGKKIRYERLINRKSQKMIVVPLDHGVSVGPIDGLVNLSESIEQVAIGGANAVVMHKGMVDKGHRKSSTDIGLVVHLSASTDIEEQNSLSKHLVCTVEEAMRYGADGVSIHVNLGPESEGAMLEDFGHIAERCVTWGMPLMAMVYPRYYDPKQKAGERVIQNATVETVSHSARLAAELGADVVKVPMLPEQKDFARVVEGAQIPVVIAGGSRLPVPELLKRVEIAMKAGAAGLSIGRNVFQAERPDKVIQAFGAIVHEDMPAFEAERILNS